MKKVPILIIFIISNNLFSQDPGKMQNSIDSLKEKKSEYVNKIQLIDNLIKEIEAKRTIAEYEGFSSLKYIVQNQLKIRDKANSSGAILSAPAIGSEIDLIDYDDTRDYWRVKYLGHLGYVSDIFIKQSTSIEDYKHYLVAKKAQLAEENKRMEAQNIEDKRKLQAKNTEENRKLQEQIDMENEKNRKLFVEQRRKSIISKYGSEVAAKILAGKIWLGMTDEMAKDSWDAPDQNNRSVGSWGVHEQWVYRARDVILYFENGILTSWQDYYINIISVH